LISCRQHLLRPAVVQLAEREQRSSGRLERLQRFHAVQHIGFGRLAAAVELGRTVFAQERVAVRQQRRRQRRPVRHTQLRPLNQHPPDPWVNRQPGQFLAERCQCGVTQRPEQRQQLQRVRHRLRPRRVEPAEVRHVGFAEREQLQHRPAQVHAADFRLGVFGPGPVAVFVPQPHAHTRLRPPGPPGPLVGARPRDRHQPEPVHAHPRLELQLPGQPTVHHRRYALHRHARLGHVRTQHHLAAVEFAKRPVLLFRRQVAVQGQHLDPVILQVVEQVRGLADLPQAGQERQHVAGRGVEQVAHRRGDGG
jgi:hypothetical protein